RPRRPGIADADRVQGPRHAGLRPGLRSASLHSAGGGLAGRCNRERQHPRCLRLTTSGQAARSRGPATDCQRPRRWLRAAMKIRTRLLIVSLVTLAAGLGLLLFLGNLLFAATINGQTERLLVTRADAQVAALNVGAAGVSVRPTHNDET